MAPERGNDSATAKASILAINSSGARNATRGSVPVGGRPFLRITFSVDVIAFCVRRKSRTAQGVVTLAPLLTETHFWERVMATQVATPSRRGMLAVMAAAPAIALPAAAAAQPVNRTLWDQRRTKYELLQAWADADGSFGRAGKADAVFNRARAKLEGQYGDHWRGRATAEENAAFDRVFEDNDAACEVWCRGFADPMESALATLVMTPAPDVEAVQFKIAIIRRTEIDALELLPRDAIEFVDEDMRRLMESAGA